LRAQQSGRVRRIGVLMLQSRQSDNRMPAFLAATSA